MGSHRLSNAQREPSSYGRQVEDLPDLRLYSLFVRFFREYLVRPLIRSTRARALSAYRHSLCTTEFIQSRVSYDWLCNALEVYRPQQREYGRLNIEGTVMSKRKILQLVREGHVSGWDDPRLYTLIALRRRGVPPGAIMALINELGVGESAADVSLKRFDQAVRAYAERTVPRLSLILRPLRLVIDNADELTFADPSDSSAPNAVPSYITRAVLPNSEDMGNVRQSFSREVYIDANDFRATPSADFQRLVPGGRIGLLGVPATFLCTSHTDTEVRCRYEPVPAGEKPRHKVKYIHWVDTKSAVEVEEVRLYDQLFTEAKPDFKRSDWISQLNPKSVEVLKGAVIESSFWVRSFNLNFTPGLFEALCTGDCDESVRSSEGRGQETRR